MKTFFTTLLSSTSISLFAQIITTAAGGYTGDGGQATSAAFNFFADPGLSQVVSFNPAKTNLYVADIVNHRIRKINMATRVVTTVAGNGTSGFSGDGGQATSAQLCFPSGIAIDASENIYIADFGNSRIRKVTAATGVITTIAGNGAFGDFGNNVPATSASFDGLSGLAVDGSGNIYLTDYKNHLIRKITVATGIVSTIAGDGNNISTGDGGPAIASSVGWPQGIAFNSSGDLFFTTDNRVRKITMSTGIINSVPGTDVSSPNGVAFGSDGSLYIAGSSIAYKVNITTGARTTVAGTGNYGYSHDGGLAINSDLEDVWNIAVGANNDVYLPETASRIRKVTGATGIISTFAGDGLRNTTPGTGLPCGDGGQATSARLNIPVDVAIDAAGNMYIADLSHSRIRKVTKSTGVISTVVGDGTFGFSGDGAPAVNAQLYGPSGVALDPAGNIYIIDIYNSRIRKVSATTGIITTVAGNGNSGFSGDGGLATNAEISAISGIAVDAAQNIYFADDDNSRIRKVSATTNIITTIAGTGTNGYSGDGGLAVNADISISNGIKVDAAGNIFFSDSRHDRIRKINSAGIIIPFAGNGTHGFSGDGGPAIAASINSPEGLAIDAANNVYFADADNARIRKVAATTGIITTIAGNGTRGFSGDGGVPTNAQFDFWSYDVPEGLASDASGILYLADAANHRIRRIGPGVVAPVTFFAFTATKAGKNASLKWSTASEINNACFEVHRSANGKDFKAIDKVVSLGNSNDLQHYAFIDLSPLYGRNYYRLKQLDVDGKYSYSKILSLDFNEGNETFLLYPNPAKNKLSMELNVGQKSKLLLQIVNNLGSPIVTWNSWAEVGLNTITIPLHQLPSGIYILKLTDAGGKVRHGTFTKE